MSDILERLRTTLAGGWAPVTHAEAREAADEITRLRQEIEEAQRGRDEARAIPAPEDVLGSEWGHNAFRAVLGESYHPAVWGTHRALNHRSLRQALRMAQQRAPEVADVIAALIWRTVIVDNRAHHAFAAQAEADTLRGALARIAEWADAYPVKVFPEPDWKRVQAVLEGHGLSLDAVSASNMRHVTRGVGKIARDALAVGAPVGAEELEMAREALIRVEKTRAQPIEEWAEKLAADLAKFRD